MFGRQSAVGARKSMGDDLKAASQPAQPDNDAAPRDTVEHRDAHTFTGKRHWPSRPMSVMGLRSTHVPTLQTTLLRVAEQEAHVGGYVGSC